MKEYLRRLPKETQDLIRLAAEVANKLNMRAYLVGGFVRDLILGVKNLDLDITVEGDGIRFAESLAEGLGSRFIRHRRFGTATISVSHHLKIDIATARSEFYPQPAYLPQVSCGSLREDLFRRDFTINAMAIDINKDNFGRLIDCFGGKDDLARENIRVLHIRSFIDDPTRILRAIRFEKRYGFKIEPATLKLLKKALELKMLEKVEPQRVRDDLILMLKERQPLKQIKRLYELAGFKFISKDLSLSRNSVKLLEVIKEQISWFTRASPHRRQLDTWLMYLVGILDPLAASRARVVCHKFSFRKGEEKRILGYKKITSKFISELSSKAIKPSRVFYLLEPLSYEVIILIRAKYKNSLLRGHISDFFKSYNGMRIHVSGEDLRSIGVPPGPDYQKIFRKILKAKLNGLVGNKEEEVALMHKLVRTQIK